MVVGLAMSLVGCQKPQPIPLVDIKKDYDRQLPPGQFALKLVDPSKYPKFGDAWYKAKGVTLREAINNSIHYLNKPSSKKYIRWARSLTSVLASLHLFPQVLGSGRQPGSTRPAHPDNFDVYMSIGCDDEGTVLFTGYYSPIFEAA
jgi:membrane-bound lytic murein transglycosylase A